jgi:hypothetical protein
MKFEMRFELEECAQRMKVFFYHVRLVCANRNGNSGNRIQRVELKDNTLKIKLF